ncbi:mitogen-activated protein kinase kinase kinase 5-like isoform X2 [Phoenix dactylifera]|uniref:mitogen-activated protein kinase kinase kinase n=1 Tax=Phoenix dactylifera TaxID=42345 RepID=A0A8B7C677_PHODC|nr:mitogen-activated protein kinase kinase kinase 5-like isoform X2 [Phoenix dactylifera]
MPCWKRITNSPSTSPPRKSSSSSSASLASPRRDLDSPASRRSTSNPASPASRRSTRRDPASPASRRDPQHQQPRLTRQRKLRHLSNVEIGGLGAAAAAAASRGSANSTPVSRSLSNINCVLHVRSTSSPVLPRPLPLPESGQLGFEFSSPSSCPLPSPGGASCGPEEEEANGAVVGRLANHIGRVNPEHNDIQLNGSAFSHHRKVFQDPNSFDTGNFILNIPAKSAPTSGFSSPVRSPRRLSNVDISASGIVPPGFQHWSSLEIPSIDMMTNFSPRASPEKIPRSPDCSPLHSPARKCPVLRPRNPSAPPSPLHSKMFPDNPVTWHESNNNVSVHPLPLPPGAPAPSLMTGQWQKGKLIGSGTFGNVYEATNRKTGALCAMKEVNIIPDDSKSAECLKQLEQEIKFLSQFKHPNIVQYYGSETIEDRFYIYLEYVHPGSINKYVHQHCGAMTESVVRNFTRHILNGLAYLHSKKTMHRDIKGANLLVDVNGVVKLADFGMAKHLSGAAAVLSLKGTPHWMAPEVLQATMNKDIGYDLAVDIWSLGCTVIEMYTGKHPWNGLEGPAAMFKVLHKDPPIPETLSSEGKDFLRRCFRRNPAERPTANMLLEHPFIRNSHHYNLHGSIEAFAGIKIDTTYSSRDRTTSKSDTCMNANRSSNGEASHSCPETSESAASRPSPYSNSEIAPCFSAHPNYIGPSLPGSTTKILNGIQLAAGNFQLYTLPKPHGKEVLKLL